MQSPKAKSINKSRMMRGEAAGVCWAGGELCEEVAEGWKARHRDCDGGLGLRRGGWLQMLKVPRVRKAVHLEMRETVVAWRKGAGVSCVLARARLVMKAAVSSLQRPPTSMPKTSE